MPKKSTKARAVGRSIKDFDDPNDAKNQLNDAEKEVIAKAAQGEMAEFGDKIPDTDEEKAGRTIRAGLVRFSRLAVMMRRPCTRRACKSRAP